VKKIRTKNKKKSALSGPIAMRQLRTTINFGDEGLPLECLGTVKEAISQHHRTFMDRLNDGRTRGFVPISISRYVELHLASNPGTDRQDLMTRLQKAVEASKSGSRCACGAPIWVIGSAEVGMACFTCITGEAVPDDDYEIDEALV
jgi:hypothetical protein